MLAKIQKVYAKDALAKAYVFTWLKAFREGRENVRMSNAQAAN